MSTIPPFSEKRRVARARRLRLAKCVFNGGSSSLEAVVRDISPSGARIAGDRLIGLPQTFEFRVDDGAGGYASRRARLIWLKRSAAGIEFID